MSYADKHTISELQVMVADLKKDLAESHEVRLALEAARQSVERELTTAKVCMKRVREEIDALGEGIPMSAETWDELCETVDIDTDAVTGATSSLCQIYFEIAAECIGEVEVRKRRDARISSTATHREGGG